MTNININKIGEALNTKADIDLNNTGVFSTVGGGGVNLVSSTSADASGKEVTSADFVSGQITETKNLIPSDAEISGMSMPSTKYIDLTLGASGTTYTAPANGWFTIHNEVSGNNVYFNARIALSDHGFVIPIWTGTGGSIPVRVTVPCLARSTFIIQYNCKINSTPRFRFIYAQGGQ